MQRGSCGKGSWVGPMGQPLHDDAGRLNAGLLPGSFRILSGFCLSLALAGACFA